MIDDELLARLERLAQAATPGPWMECCESGDWWIARVEADGNISDDVICDSNDISSENSMFIEAANPAVVLDLIAEVRESRQRIAELEQTTSMLLRDLITAATTANQIAGERDALAERCLAVPGVYNHIQADEIRRRYLRPDQDD